VSRVRAEHGFTLVELLVTMAITTIIFGATLSVLDVFQRNNVVDQQRNEVQDNARTAMDQIARQLRNVAAPSAGSAGALLTTEAYSTIFDTIDNTSSYVWENNLSQTEMVRYCVNDAESHNEVLWTQSKRWKTAEGPKPPTSTSCPDLSGSWESSRQLVEHVTNEIDGKGRPMFIYSAATAPQTASVEVDIFLDLKPGQAHPGETELTSGIGLRNANRPPIAQFTPTFINKSVRLDASASYDPQGLALSYQWWKDGVELASTSQVVEHEEEKGTHTYKLEITDAGGLAETLTQTVTF
jgi:prepilin-type N-terminal cleavage/methylation domain-containing protein